MTSSASENASWADLLQLYHCPVWEDQWGVQNVHFSSLLLKWLPEVPRAKVHTWTCLWRVSKWIQSVFSSRSFSLWPKYRCSMTCLPLSRERWEMLSFSIKASCRFYKIINSSGSSRDTCPRCSCGVHSCSLKVNYENTGLVQCWEIRPDRCPSHLLFRASSRQEPTISPSQSSLTLIWNLFCRKLSRFLLVLHFKLCRETGEREMKSATRQKQKAQM